jgi:hypothetical protein
MGSSSAFLLLYRNRIILLERMTKLHYVIVLQWLASFFDKSQEWIAHHHCSHLDMMLSEYPQDQWAYHLYHRTGGWRLIIIKPT